MKIYVVEWTTSINTMNGALENKAYSSKAKAQIAIMDFYKQLTKEKSVSHWSDDEGTMHFSCDGIEYQAEIIEMDIDSRGEDFKQMFEWNFSIEEQEIIYQFLTFIDQDFTIGEITEYVKDCLPF